MGKNIVAIVGIETVRSPSGKVLRYADTFWDNMLTYRMEHPEDNVALVDARDYIKEVNPIEAVWRAVVAHGSISKLLYSGHSSSESLVCFSHTRKELPVEQRYFRAGFHYTAPWESDATFTILGCQAGGERAQKWSNSIAQIIANKINRTVWAFVSKSYQTEGPKCHFHQVADDKIGLVEFTPMEKNNEAKA